MSYLFLIDLSFIGVSGGICFVIVAFPGYLYLTFSPVDHPLSHKRLQKPFSGFKGLDVLYQLWIMLKGDTPVNIKIISY